MDLKGRTAIVTGASSGIGESAARRLAERGMNLFVVARRKDRLEKLKADIESKHHVTVDVLALDLSSPEAPEQLYAATEGSGRAIDVLINNAGFGTQGDFVAIPWSKSSEQMRLNIFSLTELTYRFVMRMKERNTGYILNVASIGAYMPVPGYATYAAGKAFVRNFSEALAHELRQTAVRVCCLCPGPTETEFLAVSGQTVGTLEKLAFMTADRCARIGLRALFGGRRLIVSGFMNTLTMWWLRFLPRRLITWGAAFFMEKKS
jgi:short-subunit dehydrogenase